MKYSLGEPKYSVEECIERDMTLLRAAKATLQLVVNEEVNGASGRATSSRRRSTSVELPLLTPLGTFVDQSAPSASS